MVFLPRRAFWLLFEVLAAPHGLFSTPEATPGPTESPQVSYGRPEFLQDKCTHALLNNAN